jgi:hypothetical protein
MDLDARRSLSIAAALADDARRRAADDRRSGGYRTHGAVTPVRPPRRRSASRGLLEFLLRPLGGEPKPVR